MGPRVVDYLLAFAVVFSVACVEPIINLLIPMGDK